MNYLIGPVSDLEEETNQNDSNDLPATNNQIDADSNKKNQTPVVSTSTNGGDSNMHDEQKTNPGKVLTEVQLIPLEVDVQVQTVSETNKMVNVAPVSLEVKRKLPVEVTITDRNSKKYIKNT